MGTTKEKVRERVIELLDDIRPHLESKLDKLLESGAINFEKEEDNYALPKDIVQALAKEMEFQYKRHCVRRKDIQKIKLFYSIM